jgi:adenosine deaminase
VPPGGGAPRVWFQNAAIGGSGQNPAHPGDNPLPWTNLANIAFNNKAKTLLVTNHAGLTGLPDPSAIFDVYVKDKAGKLFKDDDDD